MRFKEILSKVQSSDEFKKWYAEHDNAYLAHIFFTDEGKGADSYDVGYYVPGIDKMASFEVGEEVCLKDFSDVFKEPGTTVSELDIEKVKVSADEALETASKLQKEKYPAAKPFKRIVILQNFQEHQIWNVTNVAQTFETLNIKVDAASGKVIEDKLHKIFSQDIGGQAG